MTPALCLSLLELLVVLAIVHLILALVSPSLRPSTDRLLWRDATRLQAQLEAARVQARAQGVWLSWAPTAEGYGWQVYPTPALASGDRAPDKLQTWSSPHIRVRSPAPVLLGPEPILNPTRIVLEWVHESERGQLEIVTDGLAAFEVRP